MRWKVGHSCGVARRCCRRRWLGGCIAGPRPLGESSCRAVPGMVDEYVRMCETMFAALGTRSTPSNGITCRKSCKQRRKRRFRARRAHTSSSAMRCRSAASSTTGSAPNGSRSKRGTSWVALREPPLFGTEPDARVWALAARPPIGELPGARHRSGTGRNSLALARRGHPVDAVEMTPLFADGIRATRSATGSGSA